MFVSFFINVFTWSYKVSCEVDHNDVDHNLHSLPNLYWHYQPVLRLAVVFEFLQMTLLINKFTHSCMGVGSSPGWELPYCKLWLQQLRDRAVSDFNMNSTVTAVGLTVALLSHKDMNMLMKTWLYHLYFPDIRR